MENMEGITEYRKTALDFEIIASSDLVWFIVGPTAQWKSLHRGLMAQLSPALQSLSTSKTSVDWANVSEETFIRFSEWAYTSDYSESEPNEDDYYESPEKCGSLPIHMNCAGAYSLASCARDHGVCDVLGGRYRCWCEFCWSEFDWEALEAVQVSCMGCKRPVVEARSCQECGKPDVSYCDECVRGERPMKRFARIAELVEAVDYNKDSYRPKYGADYSNVFLCHAELYVLSEKYGIGDLRALTKQPGFLRRIWAHQISFFVRHPELG